MEIINDYEGSSIEIIEIKENKCILSLEKENGKYSYYFNFKIITKDSNVEIIIKNIDNSQYSNSKRTVFIKECDKWKKCNSFKVDQEGLHINVDKNKNIEISSSPRYVLEDLEKFENSIGAYVMNNTKIPEIRMGNKEKQAIVIIARQHPGETLSSFFLEGMIKGILNNKELLKNYMFIIFPFVNVLGVKEGNHRYYNKIDYNRSWKKNEPKEIQYIKKTICKYNIKDFIDIHNDEVTNFSYVRTNKSINEMPDIKVLKDISKAKRFIRAIIKERKIIDLSRYTAREFAIKKYKCRGILIELSMLKEDCESSYNKGKIFIEKQY